MTAAAKEPSLCRSEAMDDGRGEAPFSLLRSSDVAAVKRWTIADRREQRGRLRMTSRWRLRRASRWRFRARLCVDGVVDGRRRGGGGGDQSEERQCVGKDVRRNGTIEGERRSWVRVGSSPSIGGRRSSPRCDSR